MRSPRKTERRSRSSFHPATFSATTAGGIIVNAHTA
jgi:hypothetical protein